MIGLPRAFHVVARILSTMTFGMAFVHEYRSIFYEYCSWLVGDGTVVQPNQVPIFLRVFLEGLEVTCIEASGRPLC